MTMPTNENPDFIALDMGPTTIATPADDSDFIALDMGAPEATPVATAEITETPAPATTEASTVDFAALAEASALNAAGTAGAVGSIRRDGYIAPTGNDGNSVVSDPAVAEHNRRVMAEARAERATRAPVVATITTPTLPTIDRGLLPREATLRAMAEESPGTLITVARAQRRATHVPLRVMVAALAGTEFADFAPRQKSDKRQFGEVMRSINSQEFRTWAITRRDVQNAGQEWPTSLEARWCMGALNGSDDLGSLGEKVLIADLLDNGEIRFTGGSDVLRQKVLDAFATRCGEKILTATDLLTWFRDRVLPEHFHAFDCAGAIYVPGNPARIESFLALIAPHMSRRITLWDMVTGKKLSDSLMQGLIQMLDEIDADYGTDVEKAREREQNKVRKQNPDSHTDADLEVAARRAVVLPERAGTYLRRLFDCQAYLDGLKKLLGDDTNVVRERLAAIKATIEPLCDSTSAMGAAIEMD